MAVYTKKDFKQELKDIETLKNAYGLICEPEGEKIIKNELNRRLKNIVWFAIEWMNQYRQLHSTSIQQLKDLQDITDLTRYYYTIKTIIGVYIIE